jgi:superfamily II helicase
MIMSEDRCVCCGKYVPEGRQVCNDCEKISMNENPKFNSSHCKDLTAFEAIEKVSKEQTELDIKVYELIKTIKSIIRLAGFELVGRIQIKHRKTRKLFK